MSDIRDHGAASGRSRPSTEAIQRAIDDCSAGGGGVVGIPEGSYLSAPVELKSGVELHLEEGAVLKATEEIDAFPVVRDPFAHDRRHPDVYAPFIRGVGLRDVAITGAGTIDGSGSAWWRRKRARELHWRRPRLIGLTDCSNVRIEGVTAVDSPEWTIHILCCEDVDVQGVTVRNPPDSPNTDGIVPDSSRNVSIAGCLLDVGDDCIAIKSGLEHSERAPGRGSCEGIRIAHCTMLHGHSAVALGSETSGWIRDVEISDCTFTGSDRGVRIKSRRPRGGGVERVRVARVNMERVPAPMVVNLMYNRKMKNEVSFFRKLRRRQEEITPRVRDVRFVDIVAREVEYAVAFVCGLPNWPVQNVLFERVRASVADHGRKGYPAMIKDIRRSRMAGFVGQFVESIDLRDVTVDGPCDPLQSFSTATAVTTERLVLNAAPVAAE